jgi:molybdopterin synthase sulfur carrier subunit
MLPPGPFWYNRNKDLQVPRFVRIPYNRRNMVKILLFAALKDIVGEASLNFQVPSGETTPQQVWASLVATHPDLHRYQESIQVAVNQKHVDLETSVSDGDEIAFFPPVSGGAR